jgi:hypothetical protein
MRIGERTSARGRLGGVALLAVLGACAGQPQVEGQGEAGVRVYSANPLSSSATLQPEADRYCRQFGRIAEPAGSEQDADGDEWHVYSCLPE